jgi:hypothetical protein
MKILARVGIALLLALTLPLFYYFVVFGGVIPWFGILLLTTIPELRLGYVGLAVDAVHLLVYAPLIWLLAGWLLGVLGAIHNRRLRSFAAAILVAGLVAAGFAPIHGIGHDHVPGRSAYSMYFSLVTEHRV